MTVVIEFDGLPLRLQIRRPGLVEMIRSTISGSIDVPNSNDVPDMTDGQGQDVEAGWGRHNRYQDFDTAVTTLSPLKDNLLRILASPRAASSIQHGSGEAAIKLIVLDLLRAVIERWAVFASHLKQFVATAKETVDTEERLKNMRVCQKLQSIPRDIRLATDHLFASVERDLSPADCLKLEGIKLEMDSRIRSINDCIGDIASLVSSLSNTHAAVSQDEQALSLKRLTTLAAIFLPLSLASSLLSMGTRTIDLGVLWYDYLGVSVLLVFLAGIVYQSLRIWDMADWTVAVNGVLVGKHDLTKLSEGPLTFINKLKMARVVVGMAVSALIMVCSRSIRGRKAYVVCDYALGLAVVASFVVGMFHNLTLGLTIMGYAVAGWVGVITLLTGVHSGLKARKTFRVLNAYRAQAKGIKANEREEPLGPPRRSREGA